MIYFFREDYAWLSNYAECNILLDGITYQSVESAFIAAKQINPEWRIFCRDNSARIAKIQAKKILIRKDWDNIKLNLMYDLIKQKFNQEPFKSKLLNTEDENIIEGNYWNDTFWGVDLKQNPNWGENHLGRIIMKVRSELQNENN